MTDITQTIALIAISLFIMLVSLLAWVFISATGKSISLRWSGLGMNLTIEKFNNSRETESITKGEGNELS